MSAVDKALCILLPPTLAAIALVSVWLFYEFRREISSGAKPRTPNPKKQVRPCPRCRAEIRTVAKFCHKCGASTLS